MLKLFAVATLFVATLASSGPTAAEADRMKAMILAALNGEVQPAVAKTAPPKISALCGKEGSSECCMEAYEVDSASLGVERMQLPLAFLSFRCGGDPACKPASYGSLTVEVGQGDQAPKIVEVEGLIPLSCSQ